MNAQTGTFDLPAMPGGMIAAYDSETGVIQDAASVRDPDSYRRYLLLRSRLAGAANERREGDSGKQE